MEEKKLIVNQDTVCGRPYYYPINEIAQKFYQLASSSNGRRKSLTNSDLDIIKTLGFEIEIRKPKVVYE